MSRDHLKENNMLVLQLDIEDAALQTNDKHSPNNNINKVDAKGDNFVFGLADSGLVREKGKKAQVYVEGDELTAAPYMKAMVLFSFASHLTVALTGASSLLFSYGPLLGLLSTMLITAVTWAAADLGSGIFHWSVDNYGNGRTPVLGNIIAAFQGHHTAPWTIVEREFCNNVHKLCIPFGPILPLSTLILHAPPGVQLASSVFCFLEVMSQELHKFSHMTKKECPPIVNFLMDKGIVLGRIGHSRHHAVPFSGNYCIVSGFNNDWVDRVGLFRWMELKVYKIFGVESNSWKLDENLKDMVMEGKFREANRKGVA
ncbi:hypothetical protein TrCOL_g2970 [Triparma columacea]|uniref:Lipid desaturase domain-containing protein n=1 Tax=Triparma columacea TaxID=722753 RepID=A0A9W7G4R8_9STRA|nr:hypothetical protein TrCOL_g2970 [Triparma columacea]